MKTNHVLILIVSGLLCAQQATAAIALDRTRVIFSGGDKSVSMSISNENKQLPYLAQGWIEDANGKNHQPADGITSSAAPGAGRQESGESSGSTSH